MNRRATGLKQSLAQNYVKKEPSVNGEDYLPTAGPLSDIPATMLKTWTEQQLRMQMFYLRRG
jgi:hypothetical protein